MNGSAQRRRGLNAVLSAATTCSDEWRQLNALVLHAWIVERITTLLVVIALAVASLLPPLVAPCWAQDVISQEEPPPESVEQDQTPIDRLIKRDNIQGARPFP